MKNIFTKILISTLLLTFNYIAAQEMTNEKEAKNAPAVNEAVKEEPVQLINSEPFYYCALEMKGSYAQHADAFNTLYQEIGMQNLGLNDTPAAIYWNDPKDTPVDELKWELGMLAEVGMEVKEPLKLKKWDYLLLAARNYEGAFETEAENNAIRQVYTWIAANGYIPAGPLVRRFMTMPVQNELGQWTGKSMIFVPVRK